MSIQLFGLGHELYGAAYAADAILGEMLESDFSAVAVEINTAVGSGITMCGQGVVGAAGIIASTLTGIFAKEYATCVNHLIGQLGVVLYLQDKMLRRIGIRQVDGLLHVLNQYQTTVFERLGCHLLAGKQIQLAVHFGLNIEYHLLGCGNQEYLRVDAMLSLRKQVGCHKLNIGILIGNHTNL